jgi:U3 small nucleolar RNA-associated protein 11
LLAFHKLDEIHTTLQGIHRQDLVSRTARAMSSLRNAVKRITHKERAQPQARSHFGLLEKKKDYQVRAKDFHKKEDRLNKMRTTAALKNPDEFYFGMQNAKVEDGHHRKTQEAKQREFDDKVGLDTIRIMKDQDLSYIRMQKQKDAKKIERMRASLQYLDEGSKTSKRKHTIFVEDQAAAETFNVAEHFETVPEMAGRAFNRQRLDQLRSTAMKAAGYADDGLDEGGPQIKTTRAALHKQVKEVQKQAAKLAKARSGAYSELEARAKRVGDLALAEAHLVTEKLVASKGRKRKIKAAEDGKPAQYKWRRKRL